MCWVGCVVRRCHRISPILAVPLRLERRFSSLTLKRTTYCARAQQNVWCLSAYLDLVLPRRPFHAQPWFRCTYSQRSRVNCSLMDELKHLNLNHTTILVWVATRETHALYTYDRKSLKFQPHAIVRRSRRNGHGFPLRAVALARAALVVSRPFAASRIF